MGPFIIRRFLFLIIVLFGVSVFVFGLLMTFSPERRAAVYIKSPQQTKDLDRLIVTYGLDKPFYVQYFRWLTELSKGNFGYSTIAARTVGEAFLDYLPVTLEMNLLALPLMIIFGIWIGTIAGIHRDSAIDHATRIIAVTGWSMPTFLIALILLMIFYGYFHLFPPGVLSDRFIIFIAEHPQAFHRYTGMYFFDGLFNGRIDIALDASRHLALPVLSEVIAVSALNMRIMRSGMIEELSKEYIITARAKGVDKKTIYNRHARRNALLPVITVSGQLVALSMAGSIQVEYIFNRPGLGQWLANSATQLDMPVLMFNCLFLGLVFVLVNLLVDILYGYIDPRIRLT
ncbi:MAG: ABC transporter permease [Chitinivibrionales bacterium]|nr:ABC transporter permease [Chitinivibrionales bacterium]